jgi:hypothetical protein
MNYEKLMDQNPTQLDEMVNKLGQKITFYEHPTLGDSAPVIVVCHKLKLAEVSDFFETDDMMASHGEYEPSFVNPGKLVIGG